MGNENIGRGRSDYGFPFRVVIGFLGTIDARRHDFNSHDKPSYDAFTAVP